MKINERAFRRILREEATRELVGGNNHGANLRFTPSEVSALRAWSSRSSRLSEGGAEIAVAAMESRLGRRIMISLLKAVKFLTGIDILILRHIQAPMWQKARDLVNHKMGINIPISGEEVFDAVKWVLPGNYSGMVIDEAIEILSDMSDEEYQDVVKKKKKAEPKAADEEEEEEEEEEGSEEEEEEEDEEEPEPEPANRKNPPADNKRPMLPEPVDERRIRALVRKELSHPRR
jgi:hypothetical protein